MGKSLIKKGAVNLLLAIAGFAMVCMMGVITVNVFGRTLFDAPVVGAIEIGGLAGVVYVAFSLFYTEREKSNVYVEALITHFPERIRLFLDAVTRLLSLLAVAVLFWAAFQDAVSSAEFSEPTLVLAINISPFKFIWAAGLLILCGYLLKNSFSAVRKVFHR